jgi:hypothetical protein
MRLTEAQMAAFVEEIRSYTPEMEEMGTPIPEWFWRMSMEQRIATSNGIGSDDPSVKWACGPLNACLPWMICASTLHDAMWDAAWYNDGSQQRFQFSNTAFHNLLHLKAARSFTHEPEFIRVQLQAIRRVEADAAHAVLDQCFDIWAKNAAPPEEGPERMA